LQDPATDNPVLPCKMSISKTHQTQISCSCSSKQLYIKWSNHSND